MLLKLSVVAVTLFVVLNLSSAADPICIAHDIFAKERLNNKAFMDAAVKCVTSPHPCKDPTLDKIRRE